MELLHLNDELFDKEIKKEKLVLVDFFATWCGPCRMQTPILERVKEQLGESVDIYKLDVDECSYIAKNYGVMSIPTLILFKNGVEVDRNVGLLSQEQVVEFLERNE